jgi:hypothetical protein|nr:MAG TPA: hypothetical protein [Caudoviricetes sp.]
MAKLQQMNEMTKLNSQILLYNGYVTYEGKKFNECDPFEQAAFNIALGDKKPAEKGFDDLLQGLVSPLLLQHTMNEDCFINPAIFEQLKAALQPEKDNDHEGWWHLKANCGCYTMRLSGCYDRGILNAEAEVYKTVGKHTIYYDLTNGQWAEAQDNLEAEYERLIKEYRIDESNRYYESLSHDYHQFI